MKRLLLILSLCLSASAALAADQGTPAYRECTALAVKHPSQGLEEADKLLMNPTNYMAAHCRAIALYGLKRYEDAAETLTHIVSSVPMEDIASRNFLTRQASTAWQKAGQPERAKQVLAAQITELSRIRGKNVQVTKLTSSLLVEQARLSLTGGQPKAALGDLDHAVSLNPTNVEALLLRAKAFELLNDTPLAKADAESVLTIQPRNETAKALLERLGN